jgi:hypothetical protein
VNINISTKLHKDGKDGEHRVKIHSETGCCSIILDSYRFYSPEEVEFFHPSSRTMTLGSTQPLTEMSTRNLPGG